MLVSLKSQGVEHKIVKRRDDKKNKNYAHWQSLVFLLISKHVLSGILCVLNQWIALKVHSHMHDDLATQTLNILCY